MIQTIAVLDSDEKYAMCISSLLADSVGSNAHVETYTDAEHMKEICEMGQLQMLVTTQQMIERLSGINGIKMLVVLTEDSDFEYENAVLIDRYQAAEVIKRKILEGLAADDGLMGTGQKKHRNRKVIGVYSPIHRSLQTTFTLTLGQMLSHHGRTLYINFENFSGFSGWMAHEFQTDIVDLFYFLDCDRKQLANRIPIAIHRLGGLDILPPASSYFDTYDRSGEKWIELFEAIESVTDYDYLLLDLSDAMQGLLQVLGYCDRIYTMVRDDLLSNAKMEQYEQWMVEHSYAEIIGKSLRFKLPRFDTLPDNPLLLTKSELAGYVRSIISEDGYVTIHE